MGYRFDFKKMKLSETGGIYVRTFPAAEQITIDSKISQKPGMFSNYVFVQSLLPTQHTILVKKHGYYDYFKTVPVQEGEVTKTENILLFKKNIQFEIINDQPTKLTLAEQAKPQSPFDNKDKFFIKNNNLYYSNVAENINLTTIQKSTPVIKKIVAFTMQGDTVVWLGLDGFLYKSDLNNATADPTEITISAIKILKNGIYKITTYNNYIFVNDNGNLLLFNTTTKNLDNFYNPINDFRISPDGKNIIYYDDTHIYLSPLPNSLALKNTLYKSTEKIGDCIWLNKDYIIFNAGDKVIISEIDNRGNINAITLPQTYKNPQIFFNQQEGKLYILSNKILSSSEKLTP